jgi:hypothetical protein
LAVISVISFFTIGLVAVPIAILAWFVNIVRFRGAVSNRYLGGNPIWTRDSVGIRGRDGAKKFWLSVGTNRRDELLQTLVDAAAAARARTDAAVAAYAGRPLPPPGWYDDPWDGTRIRWWDGHQWTGYAATHPAPGATPTTPPRGVA